MPLPAGACPSPLSLHPTPPHQVRVVLTRPSHMLPNFEFKSKGKAVQAFAPQFPFPKDENW